MPRYFFHVHHDRTELDYEAEELPDNHAAWHEATVIAGQTLQSLDGKLQPGREWRMEVTDEFANPFTSFTSMPRNLDRPPQLAASFIRSPSTGRARAGSC
jgi:hypothetical protein